MNTNEITAKIEAFAVNEYEYIEGTVCIIKTETGFSVLDNGEETEVTTAEEAEAIAAEFVNANRK